MTPHDQLKEEVLQAVHSLEFARTHLQGANTHAGPLASLLLVPLIAQVWALHDHVNGILLALQLEPQDKT